MQPQVDSAKRFFIKTLGCKVNQYESQSMREILERSGFSECFAENIADVYIINTCTVTRRADRESRHFVSLFHKMNPRARIVVTGCYVENDADKLAFLPGITHIIKNDQKARIADILDGDSSNGDAPEKGVVLPAITDFKGRSRAYLKIQDGCENSCAYCKVPLVRRSISSKPIAVITEEARSLVAKGFKEIVLVGICLGAWGRGADGRDGGGLINVLDSLKAIEGDFRIRLSSIEPKYVGDDLIEYLSKNKRFCRHLHIPMQSGDDDILRRMNRPYSVAEYKQLVGKLRSKIPDVAITTDVMIGFPGETDANFRNTVKLIKEALPSRTHIFTFSKRSGTAAFAMDGAIADNRELKKRFYAVRSAALMASYLYRRNFMTKKLDVLVETKRDSLTGLLTGYSDTYIKVVFQGPDRLMQTVTPVEVEEINLMYTFGKL